MPENSHISNCRRYLAWEGWLVTAMIGALVGMLLVACSGSSSRDKEATEEAEASSPTQVTVDSGTSADDGTDDGADDGSDQGSAESDTQTGTASDPRDDSLEVIRRLDRVIDHADAHILRLGLDADTVSHLQSLDTLGDRLRSARADWARARERAPGANGG